MKKAKLLLSLSSVALLAGLTGCGSVKGAEYKPGTAVKVGLICLHDTNSTYDANFINALKEAVKNLGDKVVFTDDCLLTGVAEDEHCYDAAKELVKKGCNVIFADSFGHQDYMLQAAKEWPTVQFHHATGTNAKTANLDNYHNAFASIYQGRYMAGYAAGLRLVTDLSVSYNDPSLVPAMKVGYVGAFPYAEVKSGYTSWFLGLRSAFTDCYIDPAKVTMDVRFTNSWYDPDAEASAAKALIDGGCVLVSQHADSMGAPGTCESYAKDLEDGKATGKDIPNVTYNVETKADCPRTYLAYSRINWAPYYEEVVKALYADAAITGEKNHNWTGTLASDSVQYNVNWDNVFKNLKVPSGLSPEQQTEAERVINLSKEHIQLLFNNVAKEIKDGTRKVFDTDTFTVGGKKVTTYLADTDGDFKGDTEVIVNGTGEAPSFFDESNYCSAPYFDLNIDGINLPSNN